MTEVTVTGDREVYRTFEQFPNTLRQSLRDEIQRIVIDLQNKVKEDKLSGQVLNVRTGKLKRSIDQVMIENDNAISGVVWSRLGAPSYASFWEFGFSGAQSVKAHLRLMTTVFGQAVKSPRKIPIGAHSRSVHQEPRSFLRSALTDMNSEILQRMDVAVNRAIDK